MHLRHRHAISYNTIAPNKFLTSLSGIGVLTNIDTKWSFFTLDISFV